MDIYDRIIKDIYKRASYLKCYKDDFMFQFRRENSRVTISNILETIPPGPSEGNIKTIPENPTAIPSAPRPSVSKQGSNAKIQVEDPAIVMMKNIMR